MQFVSDSNTEDFSGKAFKTECVVDSGSSYNLVPEKYFWAFYREIMEVSSTYCEVDNYNTMYCTYDKDELDKLPLLHFIIEGKDYTLPRDSLYVPLAEYEDLMVVEITYI